MRVGRFAHEGRISWGFIDDERAWVPTPAPDLDTLLTASPADLREARASARPVPLEEITLLAPIPDPPQFVGVGLNYRDHAEESGQALPSSPLIFAFLPSAITGPGAPIELPAVTRQVDWEAELGIVIGRGGRGIPPSEAMDHVAGYVIINDVSARDVQMSESQWTRAKSFDTFKPMGPWITTVDELGLAESLDVRLWVGGELKQASNTEELIFDVPHLVSFMSTAITLRTGAVISSGTPPGVGFARSPAEYLRPGDEVTIEIEGIGTLTNPVVDGS